MDELEDFQKKVSAIDITEWQRLFDLIPIIENTNSFGETIIGEKTSEGVSHFPYVVPEKVVRDFHKLVYDMGIVLAFDWGGWEEGDDLINDENTDYNSLDIVSLCKLITFIVRADRFNEGHLVSCFEAGIVLKILKA